MSPRDEQLIASRSAVTVGLHPAATANASSDRWSGKTAEGSEMTRVLAFTGIIEDDPPGFPLSCFFEGYQPAVHVPLQQENRGELEQFLLGVTYGQSVEVTIRRVDDSIVNAIASTAKPEFRPTRVVNVDD